MTAIVSKAALVILNVPEAGELLATALFTGATLTLAAFPLALALALALALFCCASISLY